jgi:hypothetical protein
MKFPVIGIAGPARSGKDTAAELIIGMTGGYRYGLADPIKDMIRAGFGIDPADPYWIEHKEDPIPAFGGRSPRYLWQTLGTEWGRQLVAPDIWLTIARGRLLERGAGMVVSDIRFENEAHWVRSLGGKVIHLRRINAASVNAHSSENGVRVSPLDVVIDNNSSIEDLQVQLQSIVLGRKT